MLKVRSGWNHIQCVSGVIILHIAKATPITISGGLSWKGFLLNTGFIDESNGESLVIPLSSEHDKIIGRVPYVNNSQTAFSASSSIESITVPRHGRLSTMQFTYVTEVGGASRYMRIRIYDASTKVIFDQVIAYAQVANTTIRYCLSANQQFGSANYLVYGGICNADILNMMLLKDYVIKLEALSNTSGDRYSGTFILTQEL